MYVAKSGQPARLLLQTGQVLGIALYRMDGLKTTEDIAIQSRWGLTCNLVLKVIEKWQKKVINVDKSSTLCVFSFKKGEWHILNM